MCVKYSNQTINHRLIPIIYYPVETINILSSIISEKKLIENFKFLKKYNQIPKSVYCNNPFKCQLVDYYSSKQIVAINNVFNLSTGVKPVSNIKVLNRGVKPVSNVEVLNRGVKPVGLVKNINGLNRNLELIERNKRKRQNELKQLMIIQNQNRIYHIKKPVLK